MTESEQTIHEQETPGKGPVPLKKFLVATDFTEVSEQALSYAVALAKRFQAHVSLMHVLTAVDDLGRPEYSSDAYQTQRRSAEAAIEKLQASRQLQGVPHDVLLKEGYLWDTVESFVHNEEIDLVALGTHGAPSAGHQKPGSSAEVIFRQVDCPVLTVGPRCQSNLWPGQAGPEPPKEPGLGRIVFATDFGRASEHTTRYVLALAQAFQAPLTLLHVVGARPGTDAESAILRETARIRLVESVPPEAHKALKIETLVEFGDAPDRILKVARAKHAQLIMMGARAGLTLAMHHLPESSVYTVATDAPCPLITVRR